MSNKKSKKVAAPKSKTAQKKDASPDKEYRSLTGHNYVSEITGQEHRVEPGDKIVGMSASGLRHEIEANNVEEWEARKTENVVDPEEVDGIEHDGVRARREGGELVMKEVGD